MKKKDSKLKPSKSERTLKNKSTKKSNHYVDGARFSKLIIEAYKTDEIGNELADCILKIATRLSFSPNFINYSYREEMIGDAIIKMLYAVKNKKFNSKIGSAFSYFTRIAFNAFCNRIKKEKREKEFILSLQDKSYDDLINSAKNEKINYEYQDYN